MTADEAERIKAEAIESKKCACAYTAAFALLLSCPLYGPSSPAAMR